MNSTLKALVAGLFVLTLGSNPSDATRVRVESAPSQRSGPSGKPLRTRYTINDGWKFHRADAPQANLAAYDDSSWDFVNLPHTWNIEDTLDDTPGYYRGVGWYRKELRLAPELQGKNLFIYFEGANQIADVYVNGRQAGRHVGGYTGFAIEITDLFRFDPTTENTIAIKVDNSHHDDMPPLNADFNFYGGIYRDVWLVAVDPVHITLRDHGSSGTQITTPQVSSERAIVRVRGKIDNNTGKQQQVEVRSRVTDTRGQRVAELSSAIQIAANSEASFDQTSIPIVNPKLWSPDNPQLYSVRTTLHVDGKPVDEVSNPLGFRWFSFDADRGFFLNGKHLKLRGTNRHQDYAGMGNAVPDALQVRDLEIIKDTGFNFLRLAHYPQDPSVLDAADRLGLIIWEEIPIVNLITPSAEFTKNSKRMVTEMIRQHRNHPSVVLWGYMNEVFLRATITDENTRATVALARALEAICRNEDPDRVTTIAFDHGYHELYFTSGLGDVPKVVGWNLYFGWYHDEFSGFGPFIDEKHRRFPTRPFILSEYGGNGDTRLHSLKPKRFDSTLEWHRQLHESYLSQIDARPFIAASAVWNQFDFGSEFRGETIPHMNQKGLLTFDRRPKDTYYFYKAHLSRELVLHIATADWRQRTGTNEALKSSGYQPVKRAIDVYSNLEMVELFHDDVSLGRQTVGASRRVSWEVPLHHGLNVLVARGTRDRRQVFDRIEVRFEYYSPVLAEVAVPFKELAVNVGSNAQFIDQSDRVWEADQPYRAGGWGYVGKATKPASTLKNVLNTLEDPLFQTMQEGLESYRCDVPDGDYEIELRFVEYEFSKPNQRVFNVLVNGNYLLRGLDLAREYGVMQPLSLRSKVRAMDGNGVRVDFVPVVGSPVLSAIVVRKTS